MFQILDLSITSLGSRAHLGGGGGDVKRLWDEFPKSVGGFQIKGFPNMKTLTTIYNFQATVLLHLALSIELLDLRSCCVT